MKLSTHLTSSPLRTRKELPESSLGDVVSESDDDLTEMDDALDKLLDE